MGGNVTEFALTIISSHDQINGHENKILLVWTFCVSVIVFHGLLFAASLYVG